MAEEFNCISCKNKKYTEGHVYKFLYPILLLIFILPLGGKLCSMCAEKFNGIGIMVLLFLTPFIIFLLIK